MTSYANTPAGRAAAAADMAATGTTMGRRPTGPKGPMVQPGVRGGPRSQPIYNRRKSGTPVYGAGPRGPKRGYGPVVDVQDPRMGPRGPKTGANPVYDPPRPMGPRGPRGYGPNDGGPRPIGYGPNDGGPMPMGPRITPVNVTGILGGPKTGVKPYDGKPANPRVTYGPRGPRGYGPNDGGPRPMGPRTPGPKGPMVQPAPRLLTEAPISQQAATQQAATQSVVGTPFNKPSFFKKGGAVKSKAMRGGGLARKGVGMALAKGGLARRAGGCAKRGVGRGKIM